MIIVVSHQLDMGVVSNNNEEGAATNYLRVSCMMSINGSGHIPLWCLSAMGKNAFYGVPVFVDMPAMSINGSYRPVEDVLLQRWIALMWRSQGLRRVAVQQWLFLDNFGYSLCTFLYLITINNHLPLGIDHIIIVRVSLSLRSTDMIGAF